MFQHSLGTSSTLEKKFGIESLDLLNKDFLVFTNDLGCRSQAVLPLSTFCISRHCCGAVFR